VHFLACPSCTGHAHQFLLAHTHIHMHAHTKMHTCARVHVHTQAQTCARTHTHTHTHIHTQMAQGASILLPGVTGLRGCGSPSERAQVQRKKRKNKDPYKGI